MAKPPKKPSKPAAPRRTGTALPDPTPAMAAPAKVPVAAATVTKPADPVNSLYFGDNLRWLSDHDTITNDSVDLLYLDPPFNNSADYNVLLAEHTGELSSAQIEAFGDTWKWSREEETAYRAVVQGGRRIGRAMAAMAAMRQSLGTSDMIPAAEPDVDFQDEVED